MSSTLRVAAPRHPCNLVHHSTTQPDSRWPHRLAVLLVCATFPLIWVGGLVTTTQSGMAVPDWPSTYGYNLFLYPAASWIYGPWSLFIEHGHRLLGALAGLMTISLMVALWLCDGRRWPKVLGLLALALVIGQGVLGGMRVLFDERTLAMVHGCVGPAFFALTVALAVFTSRNWISQRRLESHPAASGLQGLATMTTVLAYLQLVLGAQLRHVTPGAAPETFRAMVVFHLLMAAVLAVHVSLLTIKVVRFGSSEARLRTPAAWLAGLLAVQIMLGAASWIVKYGMPAALGHYVWAARYTVSAESSLQAIIVTGHAATGSLILAVSLTLTLRAWRWLKAPRQSSASSQTLAGLAA